MILFFSAFKSCYVSLSDLFAVKILFYIASIWAAIPINKISVITFLIWVLLSISAYDEASFVYNFIVWLALSAYTSFSCFIQFQTFNTLRVRTGKDSNCEVSSFCFRANWLCILNWWRKCLKITWAEIDLIWNRDELQRGVFVWVKSDPRRRRCRQAIVKLWFQVDCAGRQKFNLHW